LRPEQETLDHARGLGVVIQRLNLGQRAAHPVLDPQRRPIRIGSAAVSSDSRDPDGGARPSPHDALEATEEKGFDRVQVKRCDCEDQTLREVRAACFEELALTESTPTQFMVAHRVGFEPRSRVHDVVRMSLHEIAQKDLSIEYLRCCGHGLRYVSHDHSSGSVSVGVGLRRVAAPSVW